MYTNRPQTSLVVMLQLAFLRCFNWFKVLNGIHKGRAGLQNVLSPSQVRAVCQRIICGYEAVDKKFAIHSGSWSLLSSVEETLESTNLDNTCSNIQISGSACEIEAYYVAIKLNETGH